MVSHRLGKHQSECNTSISANAATFKIRETNKYELSAQDSEAEENSSRNGFSCIRRSNPALKIPADALTRTEAYKAYMSSHPTAKLIGINGGWYDISKFIPHHPGGSVIAQFVGKDATPVFKGLHTKDVLKHMRPVATYRLSEDDPAAEAFAELHQFFIKQGFFQTSAVWYAGKMAFAASLLALTLFLVVGCSSWYWHCLASCSLALFWQQCGFFMHDFMHSQGFHERKIDNWIGLACGTLGVGINSFWWQEEHYVHHALTNTVDYENGFFDPQMKEESWAQNKKLFPFFTTRLQRALIAIQHWTFLPICIIVGRPYIVIAAIVSERRPIVWLALILHIIWVSVLLCQLPTWTQVFVTYSLASMLEGILHVQLLVNHYCKPFYERKEVCEETNWYRMQVECNINIKNPVWMDWFHGGLNFHIEHHLFPLMPRHRFREASKHIKAVCARLGIEYDECYWTTALVRTLKQLKNAAVVFSLDPR
ncbi:hypothetical protein BOX15_Mlig019763g1 [Macrostomum lignano]|uniref:Cytochrome b5 heme-binding domain-containing protein n=1 Tax=Macrostomum lignano TaxID=282301 RepID=A0A267EN15_9PLAT|nr:hypothetical protein BOX15_Mlig019763g1 [Macrostomum lignano]